MSDQPVPSGMDMTPDESMLHNIWGFVREKFPPARAVAFLSPFVITIAAAVSTWVINHAPFIADQVNGDWVTATFLALVAGGIGLAYKWLDGRAKWEGSQTNAYVALLAAGKTEAAEEVKASLEPPSVRRRRRRRGEHAAPMPGVPS